MTPLLNPLKDDGPRARQVIGEMALDIHRTINAAAKLYWEKKIMEARYMDWKDSRHSDHK